MKQGKSLQELVVEIERQSTEKTDYLAPVEALRVSPANATLVTDGLADSGRPLTRLAHRQLGEYVGIPALYYDKMLESPALLAANANYWLERKHNERRLVRCLDGNVRALLSDSYRRVDNIHVANVALEVLAGIKGIKVVSSNVTESKLYIKAVSTEVVAEVRGSRRVGELVEAGVIVTNSEVGLGAVSIRKFANFLACLNGMVIERGGYRAAHLGRRDEELSGLLSQDTLRLEGATILSKVRDVVTALFDRDQHQQVVDALSDLTQGPGIVGDVPAAVQLLGEELDLNVSERSNVLRHLIAGGDLSKFGVLNAVTRAAEDCESYDRATELEEAGGRILTLPAGSWRRVLEAQPLKAAA